MFDQVAISYDETFTNSVIGKKLRAVVWSYLDGVLVKGSALNVLEINCGTGEDAIQFAERGHTIMASDVSNEMLEVAQQKMINGKLESVQTIASDMRNIREKLPNQKFDLIFSNFGGINCIPPKDLTLLASDFSSLLKPNGRFIGVIMPKYCLWEIFYFARKGKWKEGFRRNTKNSLAVKVGEETVETWYYSPAEIKKKFESNFTKIVSRPIGISLPPSYLEDYFRKNIGKLDRLERWEKKLGMISGLSGLSDHFLIDLQRKNK